jgi:hypothetical protein
MKLLKLSQGLFAKVDDDDYEFLAQHKWFAKKERHVFYACRSVKDGNSYKTIRMHREILKPNNHELVCDHINGDGLDNRKSNLRLCTLSENRINSAQRKMNNAGAKGVVKREGENRYYAFISVNKKRIHLGTFDNLEDASTAYQIAAKQHHGEFARKTNLGE